MRGDVLLLLLQSIASPDAGPPKNSDVIVTATRLNAAHQECLAGKCSVLRDTQVAIALAEQRFKGGEYAKARAVLWDAITRNRDRASIEPRPVAALYEAYATVAAHDGLMDQYRQAVGSQARILRDSLPSGDPSVINADYSLADMWLRLNRPTEADDILAGAERRARAAGLGRYAGVATLKRATLAARSGDFKKADRLLASTRDAAAADPLMARAAQVVRLQIAARRSDGVAIDTLIAAIGMSSSGDPILVSAPPYESSAAELAERHAIKWDSVDKTGNAAIAGTIGWIDVGFWIKPDGRTADMEVLRGSGNHGWADPLLRQIARRRYLPVAAQDGLSGNYRVERFTWRPTNAVPLGSLSPRRTGVPTLEVLDMTRSSAMVTAAR